MGYILPITHHTYNNYQYRMIKNKEGPYHIGSTFKVVFRKIKEDVNVDEQKHFYYQHMLKNNPQNTDDVRSYQINAIQKAELTGKGGKINVQV